MIPKVEARIMENNVRDVTPKRIEEISKINGEIRLYLQVH